MKTRRATRLLVAVAAASLITACSDDKKSSTTAAPSAPAAGGSAAPAGATEGVTIEGFAFSAATVTAGQQFTITNKDGTAHTFTDDDGTFDVQVPGGSNATLTIAEPGTYKVHCKIHSSMHGSITVG